jgi:hypothetical protein
LIGRQLVRSFQNDAKTGSPEYVAIFRETVFVFQNMML